MRSRSLFINVIPGETRVALTDSGGRLLQLLIDREKTAGRRRPKTGDIYIARVTQVVPSLNAAFLDLGDIAPAFLNAADAQAVRPQSPAKITGCVHEGETLRIQVLSPPVGEKGAKVTRYVEVKGQYLDYVPSGGAKDRTKIWGTLEEYEGEFLRTDQGFGAEESALVLEASMLEEEWANTGRRIENATPPSLVAPGPSPIETVVRSIPAEAWDRIVLDNLRSMPIVKKALDRYCPAVVDLLEHDDAGGALFEREELEAQIDIALGPQCPLLGGGSIIIEPTAALTAIDVNAGSGGTNSNPEAMALAVNIEATAEVARQLRLRNLGGQVFVDYLRMRKRPNRDKVLTALRSGLADDITESHVAGFTRLGLVEMTRRRQGPSLAENLLLLGGGGKTPETVAFEVIRALIRESNYSNPVGKTVKASPGVIKALSNEIGNSLQEIQLKVGSVSLVADLALDHDQFEIK